MGVFPLFVGVDNLVQDRSQTLYVGFGGFDVLLKEGFLLKEVFFVGLKLGDFLLFVFDVALKALGLGFEFFGVAAGLLAGLDGLGAGLGFLGLTLFAGLFLGAALVLLLKSLNDGFLAILGLFLEFLGLGIAGQLHDGVLLGVVILACAKVKTKEHERRQERGRDVKVFFLHWCKGIGSDFFLFGGLFAVIFALLDGAFDRFLQAGELGVLG